MFTVAYFFGATERLNFGVAHGANYSKERIHPDPRQELLPTMPVVRTVKAVLGPRTELSGA